jgi:hypothetical protein
MLRRTASGSAEQTPSFSDFQTYLNREVRTLPRSEAERDAMFRQFQIWREQQRKP